jgi:hypothetical protein
MKRDNRFLVLWFVCCARRARVQTEVRPPPAAHSGMPRWQDHLFIALSRTANDATDYFQIPSGRVVVAPAPAPSTAASAVSRIAKEGRNASFCGTLACELRNRAAPTGSATPRRRLTPYRWRDCRSELWKICFGAPRSGSGPYATTASRGVMSAARGKPYLARTGHDFRVRPISDLAGQTAAANGIARSKPKQKAPPNRGQSLRVSRSRLPSAAKLSDDSTTPVARGPRVMQWVQ